MTDLDPPGVRRRLGDKVNQYNRYYLSAPCSGSFRSHYGELFTLGMCIALLFVFVGWGIAELLIAPLFTHTLLVTIAGVVISGIAGVILTGYLVSITQFVDAR